MSQATDWFYPTAVTGATWTFDLTSLVVSVGYNGGTYDDGNYVRHAAAIPAGERLLCATWKDSSATALALPANAVPVGFELQVQAFTLTAYVGTAYVGLYLSKDGVANVGSEREHIITGDTNATSIFTFGGPTDLWGGGWSDVEAEGFQLFVGHGASTTDGIGGMGLDFIRARVYYDEAVADPSAVLASKMRRIPDVGAIRQKQPGVRRT